MKQRIINSLSVGNRMISENSNITNKTLVISILTLFSFIDYMYEEGKATLIYYGKDPLTFLMLFLTAYLFGHKVIKVVSIEELQDRILLSENPLVFVDKDNYSTEISDIARYKPFVAFYAYKLSILLKMTLNNHLIVWDSLRNQQADYESKNHGMLIGMLESLIDNNLFIHDLIILELPTSGIHSPTKYIGFSKENIHSIVDVISHLPHLMEHSEFRIFSTIESSFFYMLSVYVNQKTLLTGTTSRNNLSIELYGTRQVAILDNIHLMYLWNVMLKDFVFSNKYQFFNTRYTRWIIGLKIRKELRNFFGQSLKSLYIINADLPYELKQLLRNSFLKVVYLYGIRETGNIIGSNFKKDRLSLDSYKIDNFKDALNVVTDSETAVIFVKGTSVADTLPLQAISQSATEDDFFYSTQDIGSMKEGVLNFISPIGTAISSNDQINFDLYFAERSLLLLPEIKYAISFDYKYKWYIAVQVDIEYLDRINLNLRDVERKLEVIRDRMNMYLPPENVIRGIDITTSDLIFNNEGKPIRFIHKMEEVI